MDTVAENWLTARARDIRVWRWLVALLAAGLLVFILPIPHIAIVALIFGVAVVKAALVVRDYMHLKAEHPLIYVIAFVPALIALGLLLALIPDIALQR